jgi:hypothetical protein
VAIHKSNGVHAVSRSELVAVRQAKERLARPHDIHTSAAN